MKLKLKTIIEEYYYDSMEEKCGHGNKMIEQGYENTGQVYKNAGSTSEPDYRIYGCYAKYERGDGIRLK